MGILWTGDKTYITNLTGLADDQLTELTGNQTNIANTVDGGFGAMGEGFAANNARFNTVDTGITGIGEGVTGGFGAITGLLDGYNTGMNNQFSNAAQDVAHNAKLLGQNNAALGGLPSTISTGFTEMDTRFNTVDDTTGKIKNTVDQGFDRMDGEFTEAQANRDQQAVNAKILRDSGFEAATDNFNKGFTDASNQLTNTQTNVLAGQDNLGTTLDTMQDSADIYAGQSLENQTALQGTQDGFVSNFDSYIERYEEDTTLANTTRADMQLANSNANEKLREDIGSYAQATATGQGLVSDQITDASGALTETVEGGFTTANDNLADTSKSLTETVTGGFSDASADQVDNQETTLDKLANLKEFLATTGETLDANTKERYETLSEAFADNGDLITDSIDENGNTITRSLTSQGELIVDKFSVTGESLGQVSLDIGSVLTNAEANQKETTFGFAGVDEGVAGISTALGVQTDTIGNYFDASGTATSKLFDANGTAITTLFDTNGQANAALFDTQGELVTDLFDVQGNVVDVGFTNINDAMGSQTQTMGQYFDANGTATSELFNSQGQAITSLFDASGEARADLFDAQGNLVSGFFDAQGQAVDAGFTNINSAISGVSDEVSLGFNAQTGTLNDQGRALLDLGSQLTGVDAATQQKFADVSSAFDSQGQLISEATDELGNTILRQIDSNGNLVTQRLDANGQVVDQSEANLSDIMGDLSRQVGDQGSSITSKIDQGFSSIESGQEGLMSEIGVAQQTTNNATTDLQKSLSGGFEGLDAGQIKGAKELAAVASAQTDLDMGMRQEFYQLGNAFDDNGQLIRNTIDDQGNTISRAVDEQGNLLLRSFDQTGTMIGNKVININRSLYDLSQLKNVQGANVSMGNLSPAMSSGVPSSGFASPYATTG